MLTFLITIAASGVVLFFHEFTPENVILLNACLVVFLLFVAIRHRQALLSLLVIIPLFVALEVLGRPNGGYWFWGSVVIMMSLLFRRLRRTTEEIMLRHLHQRSISSPTPELVQQRLLKAVDTKKTGLPVTDWCGLEWNRAAGYNSKEDMQKLAQMDMSDKPVDELATSPSVYAVMARQAGYTDMLEKGDLLPRWRAKLAGWASAFSLLYLGAFFFGLLFLDVETVIIGRVLVLAGLLMLLLVLLYQLPVLALDIRSNTRGRRLLEKHGGMDASVIPVIRRNLLVICVVELVLNLLSLTTILNPLFRKVLPVEM